MSSSCLPRPSPILPKAAGKSERVADVAVVGAGVIGLSVALALRLSGRDVQLFDPDPPSSGCSSGNAGFIATSEAFPLASIERLLRAPRMLCDPLGPVAIRRQSLVALAPWLTGFALNALPRRRARSIAALTALNALALAAHRRLLAAAAANHLLVERGMLEVVAGRPGGRSPSRAIRDLQRDAGALQALGVDVELLDAAGARRLEPALGDDLAAAAFHPRVAHVRDPLAVGLALHDRLRRDGQLLHPMRVRRIEPLDHGCRLHADGGPILARQVVVAAGVWSRELLAPLGVSAPVAAERGYHLMLPRPGVAVSRPLSFRQDSFVATPMTGGLRLAGTAEFADAEAAPDWRRARRLVELARRYLPGLADDEACPWMGARPSFPDSLPAIGRLPRTPQVLYAFGHQHLGLTLAAVTGECVAAIAVGRPAPLDLRPYGLERFAAGA